VRLNLGCGLQQISGWTGVDFDEKLNPDIVADVAHLPFEDESIEEIYASHVLEHVPYDSPALKEWFRVLRRGGQITIAVPDVNQIYMLYKHGGKWGPYSMPVDIAYVNASVYGADTMADRMPEGLFTGPGHMHKQIFIGDMLVQAMIAAGFDEVHEVLACTIRTSSIGEVMAQGRKFDGHALCFSDKPYCLTRRCDQPQGE